MRAPVAEPARDEWPEGLISARTAFEQGLPGWPKKGQKLPGPPAPVPDGLAATRSERAADLRRLGRRGNRRPHPLAGLPASASPRPRLEGRPVLRTHEAGTLRAADTGQTVTLESKRRK